MPNRTSETKQLEWKNLVEQQISSGLSIEKWCQQNQIRPCVFHYWKSKLFPKQLQKSSFTQLNVKQPDAISLQAPGLHIRVGSDCNPALRRQLIVLLAETLC